MFDFFNLLFTLITFAVAYEATSGTTWTMYRGYLVLYESFLAFHFTPNLHLVFFFAELPWSKLKFLDESSFASRDLFRARGRAPSGTPAEAVGDYSDLALTYKVTILTDLSQPNGPVFSLGISVFNSTFLLPYVRLCCV